MRSATIRLFSAAFAREPNTVKVTDIKNIGTSGLTNISLALYRNNFV